MNPIAIYIHIPFCRTICPYCDFVKEPIAKHAPQTYTNALCREIESFTGPREALSVFFGGGTPSILAIGDLTRILETVRNRFNVTGAEITIEANPDDVTPELVCAWKESGINRVSLGVQSFNDDALRYLGRRHDAAAAKRACETVANEFDNWSLDLMFGPPPVSAWHATLETAIALHPPHMSAYGLTYEAETPFHRRRHDAIDDDTYIALYRDTADTLGAAGIHRYEVSNYARTGHASQHNLVYWRNESYAGFGTGAYSYIDNTRSRNATTTPEYMINPGVKAEAETMDTADRKTETLIQHLRLAQGIDEEYYRDRFNTGLTDDFGGIIEELLRRELIQGDGTRIRPSDKGFELNNEIGMAIVGSLRVAPPN